MASWKNASPSDGGNDELKRQDWRQNGYTAIFGYRPLSQSPEDTFVEHATVANKPRFAVVISILVVVVSEIRIFPVLMATLPFPVSAAVAITCMGTVSSSLPVIENSRFAVGISTLSVDVEILAFSVWRPHCYFRSSVDVAFICKDFLRVCRKTVLLPLELE